MYWMCFKRARNFVNSVIFPRLVNNSLTIKKVGREKPCPKQASRRLMSQNDMHGLSTIED